MSQVHYNRRTFINQEDSHYTGSIVCFDGESVINQGKTLARYTFIEIADCHGKARIHLDLNHDVPAYLAKLDTLIEELQNFRNHLYEQL